MRPQNHPHGDTEQLTQERDSYRDGFLAAACGSPCTEAQQQNTTHA
ncbi:hypothetical protein ACFYWN_44050 [Streptomyces sp. NPDC002917]